MTIHSRDLAGLYRRAHNLMRNIDGLQPQEAFDELLKYLFFKQVNEERGPDLNLNYQPAPDEAAPVKADGATVRKIRTSFTEYLGLVNSWSSQIWQDRKIHLSDAALGTLHQLLYGLQFAKISFDIRSAALREFLPAEIRRGLGIYPTPDEVVRMMVGVVNPKVRQKVYDPACGTGTFLVEVLKKWSGSNKRVVWGTEKNPRMLLLADLNIGHLQNIVFKKNLGDALYEADTTEETDSKIRPNFFDVIFTNPPFGVVLDAASQNLSKFKTCNNVKGEALKKQLSEIVFVEHSLRLLKSGATLAIVLPRSIVTNSSLRAARAVLDGLGYVYAVVILPPETFSVAGTQTTTTVLFVRKYKSASERSEGINIRLATVSNVGYDSTGRALQGSELMTLPSQISESLDTDTDVGICRVLPEVLKGQTFSKLSSLISNRPKTTGGRQLGDVIQLARTGKTPPRSSYTKEGLFLVKVGNLTGNGINWLPRERNFIKLSEEGIKRAHSTGLILQAGDILLTSSAHSPVYIAKKVDVVSSVPEWVGGKASFVGEVMLLRPNKELINPFMLLAYLRSPKIVEEIQGMVRGQTAHLHPDDLLGLHIPNSLLDGTTSNELIVENLKREATLNEELNRVVYEQQNLLSGL